MLHQNQWQFTDSVKIYRNRSERSGPTWRPHQAANGVSYLPQQEQVANLRLGKVKRAGKYTPNIKTAWRRWAGATARITDRNPKRATQEINRASVCVCVKRWNTSIRMFFWLIKGTNWAMPMSVFLNEIFIHLLNGRKAIWIGVAGERWYSLTKSKRNLQEILYSDCNWQVWKWGKQHWIWETLTILPDGNAWTDLLSPSGSEAEITGHPREWFV